MSRAGRARLVRWAVLGTLGLAAYGVLHWRAELERDRADALCVDGTAEFDSGVTGSPIACESG
ncbi:MAG: hypothetical protein WBA35_03095 [Litorimonas sp.]